MGYFLEHDEVVEICGRYQKGESGISLAQAFDVTPTAIYAWLEKNDIPRRSNRQSHIKLYVNEAAFDILTEHSAYWIGFLMADGSVQHRQHGSPELAIVLSSRDRGHLVKFRRFLESEHAIIDVPSVNAARFSVRSARLVKALEEYNIVPNKTFITRAPDRLVNNRHFWRGVIDGDGTIGIYSGKPRLELCGGKHLVEQFVDYANKQTSTEASVRPTKGIFRTQLLGTPALDMTAVLYEDCSIALTRKLNAAKNLAALGDAQIVNRRLR